MVFIFGVIVGFVITFLVRFLSASDAYCNGYGDAVRTHRRR